jgi:hypothetical protein
MIRHRMTRLLKFRKNRLTRVLAIVMAAVAVTIVAAACGTERISVSKSDPTYKPDLAAATLFNQRCGGCHTLSVAGTFGSGQNPRTYESISGPNFNVRCERPAIRVLYAITNGGFSGAYMPQNIVVGQQARQVANFVAQYSGRQAPVQPGVTQCIAKPVNPLPLTGPLNLSGSSSGS